MAAKGERRNKPFQGIRIEVDALVLFGECGEPDARINGRRRRAALMETSDERVAR